MESGAAGHGRSDEFAFVIVEELCPVVGASVRDAFVERGGERGIVGKGGMAKKDMGAFASPRPVSCGLSVAARMSVTSMVLTCW